MEIEEKRYYQYVAIILIYRNYEDLEECINSMKQNISSCQIIVVNAYFDDKSYRKIKEISEKHFCDFLNIPNKGYSYGNNKGVKYAENKYDYEYIIISNPDIVIRSFGKSLPKYDVIAPKITNVRGALQNPMMIRKSKFNAYLIYLGFKTNIVVITYLGIVLNKLSNTLLKIFIGKKDDYRIYMAHGSFVLINQNVIKAFHHIYDEKMFLFAEECVLAEKTRRKKFVTGYTEKICVLHKEDGSMKLSNLSINKELKKANIYFYEKYLSWKGAPK